MVALIVGLEKYGWEAHDGQQYGRQELFDGNMHLTTSLTKRFCQVRILLQASLAQVLAPDSALLATHLLIEYPGFIQARQ